MTSADHPYKWSAIFKLQLHAPYVVSSITVSKDAVFGNLLNRMLSIRSFFKTSSREDPGVTVILIHWGLKTCPPSFPQHPQPSSNPALPPHVPKPDTDSSAVTYGMTWGHPWSHLLWSYNMSNCWSASKYASLKFKLIFKGRSKNKQLDFHVIQSPKSSLFRINFSKWKKCAMSSLRRCNHLMKQVLFTLIIMYAIKMDLSRQDFLIAAYFREIFAFLEMCLLGMVVTLLSHSALDTCLCGNDQKGTLYVVVFFLYRLFLGNSFSCQP